MTLQADGFGQCDQQCLEGFTGSQLEQLFKLLGPDLQKVVGTLGCDHTKQRSNVFKMSSGSASSSSQEMPIAQPADPPRLAVQNAPPIAIGEVPNQQLQGSERRVVKMQSVIEQLQMQVAQLQQT